MAEEALSARELEDLSRAIAASLGQQAAPLPTPRASGSGTGRRDAPLVIDDDDDDDSATEHSDADDATAKSIAAAKAKAKSQAQTQAKRKRSKEVLITAGPSRSQDTHVNIDRNRKSSTPTSSLNGTADQDVVAKKPKLESSSLSSPGQHVTARTAANSTAAASDRDAAAQPFANSALGATQAPLANESRAQLERERLARQAARAAATNATAWTPQASSTTAGVGVARTSAAVSVNTSRPRFATVSSLSRANEEEQSGVRQGGGNTATANGSGSRFGSMSTLAKGTKEARYWDGLCRPTSSRVHSGYECFSFADVLGPVEEMESALLATFCGSPDWVHSQFPSHVKLALVQPAGGAKKGSTTTLAPNLKLFVPFKENEDRGCMHIKLFLLYYKSFLRVAVSTANLEEHDWNIIENAVYVQDFPLRSSSSTLDCGKSAKTAPFLDTLLRTHASLGTPSGWYADALPRYDYSQSDNVRLVLSVPGSYRKPSDISRNGHTGLARALQDLGLATPETGASLEIEYQNSSIGAYSTDWMRTFYRSCLGMDPFSAGNDFGTPGSRYKIPWVANELPSMKVVYPTEQTVKDSLGGFGGGGTIFCKTETWLRAGFPRNLFADSRCKRSGLLQHTKMILGLVKPGEGYLNGMERKPFFGRGKPSSATSSKGKGKAPSDASATHTDVKPFGFLYVGSHNCSLAAWGRYSEKTTYLGVDNHELGVLIPLRSENPEHEAARMITWERPVRLYGTGDMPWDNSKH